MQTCIYFLCVYFVYFLFSAVHALYLHNLELHIRVTCLPFIVFCFYFNQSSVTRDKQESKSLFCSTILANDPDSDCDSDCSLPYDASVSQSDRPSPNVGTKRPFCIMQGRQDESV